MPPAGNTGGFFALTRLLAKTGLQTVKNDDIPRPSKKEPP